MIQFYDKEITPLKFHKFFLYIYIPLAVIFSIWQAVDLCCTGDLKALGFAIEFGYALLNIIFCMLFFVGALHWKKYAWYALAGCLGLSLLFAAAQIALYAVLLPEFIIVALYEQLPNVFVLVISFIYYLKRRNLFDGKKM